MIDEKYRQVLDRYTGEVPVAVGRLANELGLKVTLASLSPSISGLIEPEDEAGSNFRIRINRYETDERQRFTVAHEIAHFLLHREHIRTGIVDNVMYRSSLSSKRETEANRLAADIVMPYDLVMSELEKLGGKRDDVAAAALARKFKVSVPAMKVRLGIA
jgi:hypothetical protein